MSLRIYNVNDSDEKYTAYRVFVNKKEVRLDCARASAFPINRRWPGHQRQLEQTELINDKKIKDETECILKIYNFCENIVLE